MIVQLAEEGWRDSLIKAVAPGAKREPDRAKPQLMVSSANVSANLTTPSAPSAHPPLLLLREEGNAFLWLFLFYFNEARTSSSFDRNAGRSGRKRTVCS